jgi:hypothetical protein
MQRSEVRTSATWLLPGLRCGASGLRTDAVVEEFPMKRAFFSLACLLAMTGAAFAQAPNAAARQPAPMTMGPGWTAPKTAAPAPTIRAAFGCDARAPNVCRFRIFYSRGDRIVTLAAGMKEKVPGVTIGGEYCMALGKTPPYNCTRKVINDKYNS